MTMFQFLVFAVLLQINCLQCNCNVNNEISCNFDGPFQNSICGFTPIDGTNITAWTSTDGESVRESRIIDGPLQGPRQGCGNFAKLSEPKGNMKSNFVRLAGPHCVSLDFYLYG